MRYVLVLLLLLGQLLYCGQALAGHAHYTSGIEGLKAATLPPQGVYYKMYNVFYNASHMRDNDGNKIDAFEASVYAQAHRFIWNTGIKILGADWIMDAIVPLMYQDIKMDGFGGDHRFGLGDICVEPLVLAWHGQQWDACAAFGVYVPTGNSSDTNMAAIGKDFWSFMFTAGGTVYFDKAKTWHASVLARYEIHTEQGYSDIRSGDDFHFEWGLGKTLAISNDWILDFGAAGYCGWQVSKDSGDFASDDKERIYALGPEIDITYIPWATSLTFRYLWEFENKNAPEGGIGSIVITKAF